MEVCKECGCEEVEHKKWIQINSGEVMDTEDCDDLWCPVCETMVEIKTIKK